MSKVNINFSKREKKFKISVNSNEVLLNLKMVPVTSNILTIEVYHFMLIARILSRCGFVKPLKRV